MFGNDFRKYLGPVWLQFFKTVFYFLKNKKNIKNKFNSHFFYSKKHKT